jgi:erythrin-vacuolar iron transport family protein
MRSFDSLSEREVLALAISLEEDDGRIYGDFADGVRDQYPSSAAALERMREEEVSHRDRLLALYRQRFGDHLPMIRREHVRGFIRRRPVWMTRPLGIETIRRQAATMEAETRQFYGRAAAKTSDVGTRQLLNQLSDEEAKHEHLAHHLEREQKETGEREAEDEAKRRLFVLQVVQPGLAGLMDGSVSTLAPLFAAAFATRDSKDAFVVGLAASIGAGISMGFAEALSDDGALTGRGHPWIRGFVCGLMTTLGGIGHTLPFLIPSFHTAMIIAVAIVLIELVAIAWIRNHYMDTPFLAAAFQVIVGGLLVFGAGVLIGRVGGEM